MPSARAHTRRYAAAAAAFTTLLAVPSAAGAGPDWTPVHDLDKVADTEIEYDASGEETTAYRELLPTTPATARVVVKTRQAGGNSTEQLAIAPAKGSAVDPELAVAPDGSAVLGFVDADGAALRFRVAYRNASGAWEAPVTIATDTVSSGSIPTNVEVGIGDDGTAVAVANHVEPNTTGEATLDARADAVVHEHSAAWDTPTRLSAVDRSSAFPQPRVDANGNVSVTYSERYRESPNRSTVMLRRRSPSNDVWAAAEDLTHSSPSANAGPPFLDVAPDGRAAIVFQNLDQNGTLDARAAVRPSASANFGPATPISPAGASAGAGDVAIAPDGTTYAAYSVHAGAPSHVGVVRARPGSGFSAPRQVSPDDVDFPTVRMAFAGNDAVLAWKGQPQSGADTFVQGTRWPAAAEQPDAFRQLEAPGTSIGELTDVAGDGQGGVVAVWDVGLSRSHLAAFDGGAPLDRDASVPSSVTAGQPQTMRASFVDRWSPLEAPAWDFGDGTSATGSEVTHAYAAPGDFTVTLRQSDRLGNTRTRTFPVHVDAPAPAAPPAEQQPPAAQPPAQAPAKPKLTQAAPKCGTTSATRGKCVLRGTATGAARVQVTIKRKGAKAKVVKAAVRNGKWSVTVKRLRRGTTTFRAVGIAADGTKSAAASRKARVR